MACSKPGVTGLGTNISLVVPYWSGTMICWRCKATSDEHMPYRGFSMGAKWRTKRHKPGTFFKAQRLAISTVNPLFT